MFVFNPKYPKLWNTFACKFFGIDFLDETAPQRQRFVTGRSIDVQTAFGQKLFQRQNVAIANKIVSSQSPFKNFIFNIFLLIKKNPWSQFLQMMKHIKRSIGNVQNWIVGEWSVLKNSLHCTKTKSLYTHKLFNEVKCVKVSFLMQMNLLCDKSLEI